jgi:proline iminopeptidase
MLPVDDLHTIYWEECGNPDGIPVLFLHGGPGAGTSPTHRRFFIRSITALCCLISAARANHCRSANTVEHHAIADQRYRTIASMLGIDQWLVFGGSWGSTLALAYGETHPERCLGFILRGIFCTRKEVDWFVNGMRWFYPEIHQRFAEGVPEDERGDLLQAYVKRLFCDDPAIYTEAARNWSRYEGSCLFLEPQADAIASFESDAVSLGIGRLEAHYMLNGAFMEDDALITNIARIRHLPAVIVQGRYDVICPPVSAWRLQTHGWKLPTM